MDNRDLILIRAGHSVVIGGFLLVFAWHSYSVMNAATGEGRIERITTSFLMWAAVVEALGLILLALGYHSVDRLRAYVQSGGDPEMNRIVAGLAGALVGGLLGFIMRPASPLIGQLPFEAVITRGANLSSLDRLLLPLAQQSFNYLLIGVIAGAIVALILGEVLANRGSRKVH